MAHTASSPTGSSDQLFLEVYLHTIAMKKRINYAGSESHHSPQQ
jgi:hypothetical protein